jgi:hypothetical protein
MHEHREREAYLQVSLLMGIYNSTRPNKHTTIVDVEGKWVKGNKEKLEVCVVFFDKLYNCAHVVKVARKSKARKAMAPSQASATSKFAPTLLQCLGSGLASARTKGWELTWLSPHLAR